MRGLGAGLVAVLCQDPEVVRRHFAAHPVPFPVAIDCERAAAKAFGVYALLGLDGVHIARPATFILDAAGIVRHRFVARFQWQSLPLEAIRDVLREMRAEGPAGGPPMSPASG